MSFSTEILVLRVTQREQQVCADRFRAVLYRSRDGGISQEPVAQQIACGILSAGIFGGAAALFTPSAAGAADFFVSAPARWLIENSAMSDPIEELTASHLVELTPVFHNAAFQMFRIEIPVAASAGEILGLRGATAINGESGASR